VSRPVLRFDAELVVAVVVLELVVLGLYHRYRSRFLAP